MGKGNTSEVQRSKDRGKLALSVSIHDCKVETFRSGGPGGQHQNKTSSGVRVRHEPSGAVGESREERSQRQNKKNAFLRMIETKEFKNWMRIQLGEEARLESMVERAMLPNNMLIEVKENGKWVPM